MDAFVDAFVMSFNEALAELVVHGKFTPIELAVEIGRQTDTKYEDVPLEPLVEHCRNLVVCGVVRPSVSWHRINKNTVFIFCRPSKVRRMEAVLATENPSSFFF